MSTRWEALYTKQKTQKRKKFQDGVVVVMVSPAGLRKAYLYDENSKLLEEKILKQNEIFKDGVELEFSQYLVQVGSCTSSPAIASTGSEDLAKEGISPNKKSKSSTNGQRRTVPQIMERLQKPARAEENHAHARQTTQKSGSFSSSKSSCSKFVSDVNTATEGSAKSISNTHKIRNFKPPQVDKKLVQPPVQFTFRVGVAPIERQVVIPDNFSDLASYRNIMSSAMIEEINLIISEFANRFGTAREKVSTIRSSRPSCKHGPGTLCIIKEGVNMGRWFYSCSSKSTDCLFSWADVGRNESDGRKINCLSAEELEQAFNCCGINFYGSCELAKRKFEYQNRYMCSEEGLKPGFISMRLGRLTGPLNHSKGDLWVIGSNANFLEAKKDDFVIVATSESYGSSRNGVTELQLLGKTARFEEEKKVYALKGPNIASEMSMLDCIRKLETSSTPLLPLLLGSTAYRPKLSSLSSDIDDAVKAATLKYKLNNDQARVLFTVSQWFKGTTSDPDVCLIHGPFGSGKSHLLVVLIVFLSEILKVREDTMTRFIISAATNSAVDRVLTGLLEHGFDDFLRVGCLSKISSKILPYSIHAASKTGMEEAEAEKDLKEILKDAVGNSRLKIEKELDALRDGKMNYRRERLKQVRVVGVTCCSTINKVLQGNTFKVCFLDECSQILEPLSLLPICQFRCEKLIAVGDPEQLPPVLSRAAGFMDTTKKDNDGNGQSTSCQNLSRTLFVRLATLGHKPILLSTQYRCHPRLALVPNRLFYGGSLLDGCSESERLPLLPGLRPLVFCDTRKEGREIKDSLNSYTNSYEAEMACSLIRMMIAKGVSGCQIGVIVLYKSQEALIRQMLYPDDERAEVKRTKKITVPNSLEDVRVSTVDAFQGLEKDIIILCCCRTNGLGFLASSNRLNVALTRARHHLIIIGKASNLQNNGLWQELLEHVRRAPSCFKSTEDMRRDLEKIDDEQDIKANASIQPVDKQHGNYCLDITDSGRQEMESKTGAYNEQPRLWEEHYAQLSPKSFLDQKKTPFGKQSKESNTLTTLVKTQLTGEVNICSARTEEALDAVNFRPQDFWEGYKLYCFGHYSHSIDHQNSFSQTLMADVLRKIHGEGEFQWGPKFDQKVRSSWCTMEEYIKQRYGVDCRDIRFLIEEYDDPEQLAATEHGSIFLDLCEDDTVVPQAKECRRIEDRSVVDAIMGQLSNMDVRLAKLMNKNRKSNSACSGGEISQELEGGDSWQRQLSPTFDLGF